MTFALMPLMGLMTKRIDQLVDEDLTNILGVVAPGATLTEELKTTVFSMLRAENVNAVADILSRPDLVQRLAVAVTTPPVAGVVRECGHCHNFNLV